MKKYSVDPCNINALLFSAKPGDIFEMQPGIYSEPIVLRNIHGRKDAPIILRGTDGVLIDGELSFDEFEPRASLEVWKHHHSYPGLYHIAHESWVHIDSCSGIIVEDIHIKQCWPTAIFFNNSQDLTFRRLKIKDSTFAIYGVGDSSEDILIENCCWLQDVTEERLWKNLSWDAIHGVNPDINGGRAFDGAFFRTRNIKGNVIIRNNIIRHAVNGIHMFNRDVGKSNRNQLNQNIQIYRNRFENIRDNAVEPERMAINWWIFNNEFVDCYSHYSLEMDTCGYFYIFGNCSWFNSKPGPIGDSHNGGRVFKFRKTPWIAIGPTYVFNNSMYIRTKYLDKCSMASFYHFNNAIYYCHMFLDELDLVCDAKRSFIKRVPTNWDQLKIEFENDMVFHQDFPKVFIENGYPIKNGKGLNPGFKNQFAGDFALIKDSHAKNKGCGYKLDLPWGDSWVLNPKGNIGAFQGDIVIEGPPFKMY